MKFSSWITHLKTLYDEATKPIPLDTPPQPHICGDYSITTYGLVTNNAPYICASFLGSHSSKSREEALQKVLSFLSPEDQNKVTYSGESHVCLTTPKTEVMLRIQADNLDDLRAIAEKISHGLQIERVTQRILEGKEPYQQVLLDPRHSDVKTPAKAREPRAMA